jgi:hypothetical protein
MPKANVDDGISVDVTLDDTTIAMLGASSNAREAILDFAGTINLGIVHSQH